MVCRRCIVAATDFKGAYDIGHTNSIVGAQFLLFVFESRSEEGPPAAPA